MKQRLSIQGLEPEAYKAMFELERYLNGVSLETSLRELVKIRASQINGCAYCIEMHTEAALKNGEDQKRIFALSAWKESPLFSDPERAALAMTEEITLIAKNGLSETTFQEAKAHFSDNEIAQLIMQIGTINTWNRMAVSTHMFHEST